MRLKRYAGDACGLVGAFLRYAPKHPVLRRDVTDEGYLAWVMPAAKTKPIVLLGNWKRENPVSNQRLERDPGPLRAMLYSLAECRTGYHVSWMFEEFQIGMCPG